MKLAPLARKFLYFCVLPISVFSEYSYFYIDSSEEEEKEEPAVHGAAPTSTSNTMVLPKNTALLRNLRLPLSKTQKHRLLRPAPEHPRRRKQGLGLATPMKLLLGVLRLPCWTM
jgi:ferric-dicitrate binding protein FerR (iron transport regulator)